MDELTKALAALTLIGLLTILINVMLVSLVLKVYSEIVKYRVLDSNASDTRTYPREISH